DDFLTKTPQAELDLNVLGTEDGINLMLIGAYANLDGYTGPEWATFGIPGDSWYGATSNWQYGDVPSDDAYKGTEQGDQAPLEEIEAFTHTATNPYFAGKWRVTYDGIARANDVIKLVNNTEGLDGEFVRQIIAEARFLRGFYHFEAKKIFNNIPYLDDTAEETRVPNTTDTWPQIEADLQAAVDVLPNTQPEPGRATKWSAMAFLAKAHMFQQDYAAALPLLTDIINNGGFQLTANYHENFNGEFNNNSETVFALQKAVNDGTEGFNGGYGDALSGLQNGPGGCCGFHQPSQNLVNAYRTDDNGLPFLDSFNDENVTSDEGVGAEDPFTPYAGNIDPRLDWTVGRRGIPYLDWGVHPGAPWIRQQSYGGPFSPKKNMFYEAQVGNISTSSGWAQMPNSINYNFVRYADVLLMAAECEVEAGSLENARGYVNQVRVRARDGGMVMNEDGTGPAANYVIDEYTEGWTSQSIARSAVRFERRLELGMEGHRFFDLVRWGVAADVINAFFESEKGTRTYLANASFTAGKNEYYPIPLEEINLSSLDGTPTLTQNPGY
ncbi:MAG: RagB/SusD family nutrient uptake outer membrane protein, partial [Bacteroidota bacterium]